MRSLVLVVMVAVAVGSCGSSKGSNRDANGEIDASIDGAPDVAVDAAVCPRVLLAGGSPVESQGWSIVMQPPAALTYVQDYTRLQTTTATSATTSGQLLLRYPDALELGKPFKLQVVMLVESVNAHNPSDSAAAILGSFAPPFGSPSDRNQMIYLDGGKIGWADDTQSFTVAVADNTYHTYELSVDASMTARVTIDGTQALMRNGFMFNGAIALGDQTNDANIDSALRIRSVTKLCP